MKKIIIISASAILVVILCGFYVFFTPLSNGKENVYVYVRTADNRTSIISQLDSTTRIPQRWGVKLLAALTGYGQTPHTGRYYLSTHCNAVEFFRNLHGGRQQPLNLTIPAVRTMGDLSRYLGEHLMQDSAKFMRAVSDSTLLASLGVNTANVYCLFVPNTYEVYWDISVEAFLKRMKRESDKFWTPVRLDKAKKIPLSAYEVYTLASIIDEETANNAEKPDIAGMYINRLHKGMPLQADPTIKFALSRFEIRRIYFDLLQVKSPYNTYLHDGLPPGPIRIASPKAIDAVLNYTRHDYLYMCAKEDFSGTHRFARTYSEHIANAVRYRAALDKFWHK